MKGEESSDEFDAEDAVDVDAGATDMVDLAGKDEEEGADEAVGTTEDMRDRS